MGTDLGWWGLAMSVMTRSSGSNRARAQRVLAWVLAPVLLVLGVAIPSSSSSAAGATCPGGALYFVAHPDDDLLFMSPDLLRDVQSGRCVRTVFLTSGDAGFALPHAQQREDGIEAAYAEMAGVNDNWTTADAGISARSIRLRRLVGAPQVSVAFLRLPDGNNSDGGGYSSYNFQSLLRLYNGAVGSISAIDSTATYTASGLRSTIASKP